MPEKHRHPLGFCPSCGPFPAKAIGLAPNISNATFINCGTNCPTCNGDAEIIPGSCSTMDQRLKLLVHNTISMEALSALCRLAERAQSGEITPEEAQEKAEEIVPGTGKLFDVHNWSDQAKATLYASIIGAIAILVAAKIASAPNQNINIQPVVERVIEPADQNSSSVMAPTDTPPPPKRKPKQSRK
jgi:hypothetical protein